jgi:hypothetical protein
MRAPVTDEVPTTADDVTAGSAPPLAVSVDGALLCTLHAPITPITAIPDANLKTRFIVLALRCT